MLSYSSYLYKFRVGRNQIEDLILSHIMTHVAYLTGYRYIAMDNNL
jgi:hypothetical protein